MTLNNFILRTSLNSRASEEAKKASRDCVDSQIIKTRLNKQQRYVFKFVNSAVVIFIYASDFLHSL
jgi:hypothetical protein